MFRSPIERLQKAPTRNEAFGPSFYGMHLHGTETEWLNRRRRMRIRMAASWHCSNESGASIGRHDFGLRRIASPAVWPNRAKCLRDAERHLFWLDRVGGSKPAIKSSSSQASRHHLEACRSLRKPLEAFVSLLKPLKASASLRECSRMLQEDSSRIASSRIHELLSIRSFVCDTYAR